MRKLVQALCVSAVVLGAAAPVSARADFWDWLFNIGRDRHHQGGGGEHRSAAAPLTLIGLGLGGAGVGTAAWLRSRRKRS